MKNKHFIIVLYATIFLSSILHCPIKDGFSKMPKHVAIYSKTLKAQLWLTALISPTFSYLASLQMSPLPHLKSGAFTFGCSCVGFYLHIVS
jgi:hypothetical protein